MNKGKWANAGFGTPFGHMQWRRHIWPVFVWCLSVNPSGLVKRKQLGLLAICWLGLSVGLSLYIPNLHTAWLCSAGLRCTLPLDNWSKALCVSAGEPGRSWFCHQWTHGYTLLSSIFFFLLFFSFIFNYFGPVYMFFAEYLDRNAHITDCFYT